MIEELFKDRLKKNKLYRTTERIALFQILKDLSEPCSVSNLVEISKNLVDRSTVYRTLELFEEIGVSTRVYSGWKYRVELSDDFSPHHHHMTCTNCGDIISFEESDKFINELNRISQTHGFKSESHSLELKGLCSNCC